MNRRAVIGIFTLSVVLSWSWTDSPWAHQDPCHRRHSCPSDRNTYVCGDLGHCEQCPDNPYCLAGKPRAASPSPAPTSPSPSHNEIMIIAGETIITGSFNFTKAAQEKHAENVLIIRDQALAAQDTQTWEAYRQHSQPYLGRAMRP
jgi:PLD-like domain